MNLHRGLTVLVLIAAAVAPVAGQESKPAADPAVSVPDFANADCPIMGKPVKAGLFVDTDNGRIYMCCKACVKKIQADPAAAYKTAYKTPKKIANTTCPVSGDAVDAKSPTMSLQGHEFAICCEGCRPKALENSQLMLVKLTNPKVIDVGNATCPVSGKPVAKNTFVLIGDHLVHLASEDGVAEVRKDPKRALAAAQKIKAVKAAEEKSTGKAKETGCCSDKKESGDAGCCSDAKKKEAGDAGCCGGAKKSEKPAN